MKLASLAVSILIISSLSLLGCSREKPSDTAAQKTVVKKPITKPLEEANIGQGLPVNGSAPAPETEKTDETKKAEKEKNGFYLTKGDESLSKIAARKDVYGDPLKWILIYRFNREAFDKIGKDEAFPDKYILAGTKLKIVSPADTGKTSKTSPENHWVVNVISSPNGEKIVPDAIRLVDNGYPAYITSANVKGQDYIRLRVGFFDEKTVAIDEGKKITTMLNVSDVWTTRAEDAEFKEFSGYK